VAKPKRIDPAPFIQALRIVVKALPITPEDREVLLLAIEDRADAAYREKQAKYYAARVGAGYVQQRTAIQKARKAQCDRERAARLKAARKVVAVS
jgi:hypothetical protein